MRTSGGGLLTPSKPDDAAVVRLALKASRALNFEPRLFERAQRAGVAFLGITDAGAYGRVSEDNAFNKQAKSR